MKFVQEKRLISKFFDEISQDSNKFVFGVKDTLTCLDMGAVETLIVWENLEVNRYEVLKPSGTASHVTRGPLSLRRHKSAVAMLVCKRSKRAFCRFNQPV